jgi:hypothetical protein
VAVGSIGIDYWNASNRLQTALALTDTGGNHTYTTAAYRQWAANANAQLDVISGLAGDPVSVIAIATANTANTTTTLSYPTIAIGIGGTTPAGVRTMEGISRIAAAPFDMATLSAGVAANAPLGVQSYLWLEYGAASVDFFGTSGSSQSGMMALVSY